MFPNLPQESSPDSHLMLFMLPQFNSLTYIDINEATGSLTIGKS